jgi:hypothetical protein
MSDLEGRCFVRRGNALLPVDFAADEMLADIKEGQEVIVTYRKPRSPEHHRFFFAMLRKVCEATGLWQDEDALLDAVKLATNHVRKVRRMDGEVLELPRSINFASLPQDPFRRFVNRAKYVISVATGIDPEELMKEVDETQRRAPSHRRDRRPRDVRKSPAAQQKPGARDNRGNAA